MSLACLWLHWNQTRSDISLSSRWEGGRCDLAPERLPPSHCLNSFVFFQLELILSSCVGSSPMFGDYRLWQSWHGEPERDWDDVTIRQTHYHKPLNMILLGTGSGLAVITLRLGQYGLNYCIKPGKKRGSSFNEIAPFDMNTNEKSDMIFMALSSFLPRSTKLVWIIKSGVRARPRDMRYEQRSLEAKHLMPSQNYYRSDLGWI